ncbi:MULTISPECIES: aldo/keto reductase [Brucella]|uniref:Aldo/keto reductase n=1 Tax=Ochrobactrum soli TaxID=2448455 RepID=A0A2P9HDU5_9HYPH|nr:MULTISPECIES: aldo/keto reductase [Brucella]MBA8822556.1 2,5-diketo-D-gluconate reductase B [Ochrobactrum sp. P6BSIII]OOL14104.1 oxidoreductase [Ochrobactrum sp. P6BS-III]MDX4075337.1 aldo/keto reductase [Brucella sp. NBRC 113783]NNU63565.1 aldo/keto reductase [[Ochrobactrum] soli]SPL62245.1 oxidoreductase, aldo/keto reductase family [[Ochrobactrum] soli]
MNIYFQKSFQRGFGTYPLKGAELRNAMEAAFAAGYRAFDTAQMYGNETDTGHALAMCDIARDELCITTKVHPENYSEDKFIPSVEASLKALRLDHVDVLLLHWPDTGGEIASSLRLLQSAQLRGLTRFIGVSNYTARMMHEAKTIVDVPLVTNQIEFHPLLDQRKLLAAAEQTGIPLSSYASIARGEVFKHNLFSEIGDSYGKSAAQIALRWILQKGIPLNTMSTRPENIKANFNIMDFTLSSIDMNRIDTLNALDYRVVKSGQLPWTPEWD